MKGLQEKLRRLTEMDVEEIRFRLAQKLRLQREQIQSALDGRQPQNRIWWRAWDAKKISDAGLRAAIEARDQVRAARLLSAYFTNRTAPRFFFAPSDRRKIADEMTKRLGLRASLQDLRSS
jgi:hypothetical protein